MRSFILFLFMLVSMPSFAQTASKIPGVEIDGRLYIEQDIYVMTCAVQTGGNHTTCKRADGTSVAASGGTQILAIEGKQGSTTTAAFGCFINHTGADVSNGAVPVAGTVGWLFGLDCTGTGSQWELSLMEFTNFTNTGTQSRGLGITFLHSINVTIPSGEKLALKMTGHNDGVMAKVYVRDL